jgi:uncharacterized protein
MPLTQHEDDRPSRRRKLRFRWIHGSFAVCRLAANAPVPEWGLTGPFTSVTRTADELSIVCSVESVPEQHKPEVPWTCFKLEGPFSFTQTGVLASFIDPLTAIPIFAISTYDTDYVLVREDFAGVTLSALQEAGHELIS